MEPFRGDPNRITRQTIAMPVELAYELLRFAEAQKTSTNQLIMYWIREGLGRQGTLFGHYAHQAEKASDLLVIKKAIGVARRFIYSSRGNPGTVDAADAYRMLPVDLMREVSFQEFEPEWEAHREANHGVMERYSNEPRYR